MSFFFSEEEGKVKKKDRNIAIGAKLECQVCPRNGTKIHSPKMTPTGAKLPIIYVLGESPGKNEDFHGEQFIGDSGNILRGVFTKIFDDTDHSLFIRYNNVLRCFHKNEKPTPFEISCCFPSIIADIEATKPIAIFGFGETPLKAVLSGKMISMWRGRKIPVKVGTHTCWFFPFYHPAFILRNKTKNFKGEYEASFEFDIRKATDFIFGGNDPYYNPTVIESGYRDGVILLKEGIREFLESYNEPVYGIDIETTDLKPFADNAELISISIGTEDKVYAFPYTYEIKEPLRKLLEKKSEKIVHNLKFELEWFYHLFDGNQAFFRNSKWNDTMAQAYLIDERTSRDEGMLNLDRLTQIYYGFNLKDKSNVDRKKLKLSDDELYYNGMDSKYEYKLFYDQKKIIDREGLTLPYESLIKTAKSISVTESHSLKVDEDQVKSLGSRYNNRILRLGKLIKCLKEVQKFENIHGEFNPLSGDHCIIVFRDILGYPQVKVTESKKYSVDKETLQKFQKDFRSRLAKYVLMYRMYSKLISTYLENVKRNSINGELYPNFNLYYTATGRLSSGREQ